MATWRETTEREKQPVRQKKTFSILANWLRNPGRHGLDDPEEQQAAALWAARQMKDEAGLAKLITLLGERASHLEGFMAAVAGNVGHGDKDIRKTVLRFLGPAHMGAIVRGVKDREGQVRLEALHALFRLDAREHLPVIAGALSDTAPQVRIEALRLLGYWEARHYSEKLARLLADTSAGVRAQALKVLADLGICEHAKEMGALLNDRARIPDCRDPGETTVRARAVSSLARIKARQFAPQIVSLLHEHDQAIKPQAMTALAQMGAKDSAPGIARFIGDKDPELRMAALWALWALDAREYADSVAGLLDDSYGVARALAIEALRRFGARQYAPQIKGLLDDRELGTLQCMDVPLSDPPDMFITYEIPLVRDHARWALEEWDIPL